MFITKPITYTQTVVLLLSFLPKSICYYNDKYISYSSLLFHDLPSSFCDRRIFSNDTEHKLININVVAFFEVKSQVKIEFI